MSANQYIVVIIALVLIILFLNRKYFYANAIGSNFKKESIKTLVRQASRWSVASTQDNNVMIAVLHANYGAGYLWALRDIATDDEIKSATGIDVFKFRDAIVKAQDDANRKMADACQNFAPSKSYLTNIAAE